MTEQLTLQLESYADLWTVRKGTKIAGLFVDYEDAESFAIELGKKEQLRLVITYPNEFSCQPFMLPREILP